MSVRIKGCGCDCAAMPADPCVACGGGRYQIECRSRAGTATLCGYSEYTTPSTPPKKYRRKTFGGNLFARIMTTCDVGGTVLRTHESSFSGVNLYNALTCAVTRGSASTGTALGHTAFDDINNTSFADSYVDGDGGHSLETLTRTSKSVVYVPGIGCPQICGTCCSSRDTTCAAATEQLAMEDKEEDAMARSPAEWSNWGGVVGCCTTKAARGAGVFSFAYEQSEYRLRFAGAAGSVVNVELTFTRTGFAPFTTVVQGFPTSPSFPTDPETGWTVFQIEARSGGTTCLAGHKPYNP